MQPMMQPMENIARLCYRDGELLLSVHAPCDVDNLLDQVDWYANRYGHIRLELGTDRWSISVSDDCHRCSPECSTEQDDLVVTDGDQRLCKSCGQHALHTIVHGWTRPLRWLR